MSSLSNMGEAAKAAPLSPAALAVRERCIRNAGAVLARICAERAATSQGSAA